MIGLVFKMFGAVREVINMLVSLSIGLVNTDDIRIVKTFQRSNEIRLFWCNSDDDSADILGADYMTLVEVSKLQYDALVKAAQKEVDR